MLVCIVFIGVFVIVLLEPAECDFRFARASIINAPSLRSAQAQRQGREQEEIRNSGIRIFRPSDEDGD